MADPTPFTEVWFGRAAAAVASALLATATTIFATRKNNEASVLSAVNERIKEQFDRQDAEIEDLRRALKEDRAQCDEQLRELRAEIDRLTAGSVPSYTGADALRAEAIGRAAQKRHTEGEST